MLSSARKLKELKFVDETLRAAGARRLEVRPLVTPELMTAELVESAERGRRPAMPLAPSAALDLELSTDARYGVDVPLDLGIDDLEPAAGTLGA